MITQLLSEFNRSGGATFPGSEQVQNVPWSAATQLLASPEDRFKGTASSLFFVTVYHSDIEPEWPIIPHWPAVIRGLRGSMGLSQVDFASVCGLGRATVERWESGRSAPFGGRALPLLSLVRPHLRTPVQAGQALNLAAAAVLPQLTRPTAEYTGAALAEMLTSGTDDHADLSRPLLSALTTARILIPVNGEGDELGQTYFPLAARVSAHSDLPEWAPKLLGDLRSLSAADRALVTQLVGRLAASGAPAPVLAQTR